jgi:hypothetical protein
MGVRGPKPTSAAKIYQLASWLYWELTALAEGNTREWFDRRAFEKETKKKRRLNAADRMHLAQVVDEEIKSGKLNEDQREAKLGALARDLRWMKGQDKSRLATDRAVKEISVRGDPDVLMDLLAAKDPEQIQRICEDAHTVRREKIWGEERDIRVGNWPIDSGSMLPEYLVRYADQFILAKNDPRFPRSNRPSNRPKQLWFLARALSGAVHGVKPRTAINLVGSKLPEQLFEESRAGKAVRRRKVKRPTRRQDK